MLTLLTFLLLTPALADEIDQVTQTQVQKHELFLTAYFYSVHWTKNSSTGEEFNETHKAYGLEYIYDTTYSLSYNHFINSRGDDVDAIGAGYLFDLYEGKFGLQLIGGYQEGYCLDGILSSVECTDGKDNTRAFVLPLLYYKHKYFKLDFFTNSNMVALRFNIKIY